MPTDVTVVIPWRPEPDRLPAYDYVRKFWQDNGFDHVVLSDSDDRIPFHRAQARNWGVQDATTEKVILADADTITEIGAVNQALRELDPLTVCYPHTRYRLVDSSYIDAPDLMRVPFIATLDNAKGGIIVTTRSLYLQLGGMDERFDNAWGYEDAAFGIVAETLANSRRIDAQMFSFDHEVKRDMSTNNPNLPRYKLYEICRGKPELMKELLKR